MSSGFEAGTGGSAKAESRPAVVRPQRAERRTPRASTVELLLHLPDVDLLLLVAQCDLDAFGAIYDRHVASAWELALEVSVSSAVAEDAVAAAFLSLWREPDPLNPLPIGPRLLARIERQVEAARA